MANVIESSWASYRVVHLSPRDDLRSALNKILDAFSYPQILKRGEPLVLGGNIPVSITGDWIVVPPEAVTEKGPGYVVINLMDVQSEGLPPTIKNYLKLVGVDVIEYPAAREVPKETGMVSRPKIANDTEELIKAVLNYRGQPFKTDVKIPAYASRNKDFTFTVQADFYLEIGGRRYVIDTEGLSPDIVSLLKENGVSVLTLTQHKDPMDMVSTILTFLNVQYTPGPHLFMAKKGDASRNVKLTLYGVTFYDQNGNSVLATPVNLPPELVEFLSQRGYQVLVLSPLPYSHSGSA